jgi:hypothetical protein
MSTTGLTTKPDDNQLIDQELYLQIIGSLNYLAQYTRPDLLYCMSRVSQNCVQPNQKAYREVIRILRYLSATLDYGIKFAPMAPTSKNIQLYCHCDAAHNCYNSGKGHYGYCFSLGEYDGIFYAISKKLSLITLSSTESEYVALCEAARDAIWLRNLLCDLGWPQIVPNVIFQDNMSTIQQVEGHRNFKATKHINPKFHYAGQQVENGAIQLIYCPTKEMIADVLTKPLPAIEHVKLSKYLLNM